jgi:hypothetical protein
LAERRARDTLEGVTGEALALILTFVVHVLGAAALIAVLIRTEGFDWRSWWPSDDDGPDPPAPEPPDAPEPSGGGLPLPGATPAPVRLRGARRLGDAYPRPARRPAHAPAPQRAPDRV